VNTRDQPDQVSPAALQDVSTRGSRLSATLAPASWNVIRLQRGG
jgi:alpha-L-arabinofuranosidase